MSWPDWDWASAATLAGICRCAMVSTRTVQLATLLNASACLRSSSSEAGTKWFQERKVRTAATLAHPRRLLRPMRDGDQGRCTGARLGEWVGARDATGVKRRDLRATSYVADRTRGTRSRSASGRLPAPSPRRALGRTSHTSVHLLPCLHSCPARRVPLLVPEGEALDVQLKPLVGGRADAFHDHLVGADDLLAGVALFTIRRAAPEARDAVVWEIASSKFAADEETDAVLVHGALGMNRLRGRARFTRVATPEASTHEAKVQAAD